MTGLSYTLLIKDIPCYNCITYAICKAQMQPYMETDNPREITVGFLQTIGNKCSIIAEYVMKERPKMDVPLITSVFTIMREIFNERSSM